MKKKKDKWGSIRYKQANSHIVLKLKIKPGAYYIPEPACAYVRTATAQAALINSLNDNSLQAVVKICIIDIIFKMYQL